RLALEFRGTDAFCSCLDTALNLVEACREPNVGVCLDVFHYYKGPSKPEDLDRLTPVNLFHVQVCDVAGVPRELVTDGDRVVPGEGDFRLEPVVRRLREIGYAGAVSLELMNPELWRANPQQVVSLGLAAVARLLVGCPVRFAPGEPTRCISRVGRPGFPSPSTGRGRGQNPPPRQTQSVRAPRAHGNFPWRGCYPPAARSGVRSVMAGRGRPTACDGPLPSLRGRTNETPRLGHRGRRDGVLGGPGRR